MCVCVCVCVCVCIGAVVIVCVYSVLLTLLSLMFSIPPFFYFFAPLLLFLHLSPFVSCTSASIQLTKQTDRQADRQTGRQREGGLEFFMSHFRPSGLLSVPLNAWQRGTNWKWRIKTRETDKGETTEDSWRDLVNRRFNQNGIKDTHM